MKLRIALLLATSTALVACGDESRREYVYKPAYCLAAGLAGAKGSDDCLPELLKEKAVAVADAQLKNATAEKPSQQFAVYYTADQRAAIGYDIARTLFAPAAEVTEESVTISLEAANIIKPLSVTSRKCGRREARTDTIAAVSDLISDSAINRDTAKFLAEHYTDIQLTELYRVAREGGSMIDVRDDAFILPDPKDSKRSINVKPKNDRKLGGILSFTTNRVASALVKERRANIIATRDAAIEKRKLEVCPPPPAPVAPAEPEPAPVQGPIQPKGVSE